MFEFFPSEQADREREAVRQSSAPSQPGAFGGFGSALADALPTAALTSASAWAGMLEAHGQSVGNYSPGAVDVGLPVADDSRAALAALPASDVPQSLREKAKGYAPDPLSVGMAGQIAHGVLSSLAKAVAYAPAGPAAPVLFGADLGVGRAQELGDKGVDERTAAAAGLMTGMAGAAGLRLPAAMGATRAGSAAIGAVANPALNVAETGGIHLLLQHADYGKIAEQHQPFDPVNLAVAAVAGVSFGAAFHRAKPKAPPALTPDEHAAALTMNEVHARDGDTLTQPGDLAASNAAREAQALARQQLDSGEMVSVAADVPTDAATVAARADGLARSLNEGDTLLGQSLDFGGRPAEHLEAEYAALSNAEGRNLTDGGHLIDTDLVRELSPAYRDNRLRAADIHEAASALTKQLYARALARPVAEGRDNAVLFMAGGGGSGKSFARESLLGENTADITVDGTFSNQARALSDVQAALDSGRSVQILYVYRPPELAIQGVIQRAAQEGRPVPIDALAQAHANAPETVRAIAQHYNGDARVRIQAVDNSGPAGTPVRPIPLQEIPRVHESSALRTFSDAIDGAHARGEIGLGLYRASRGDGGPLGAQNRGSHEPGQRRSGEAASEVAHPGGQDAPPQTLIGKVVDAVSHLLGRDEPAPPSAPEPAKPATPEQARAQDIAARNPNALIPTGELDADGKPISVPLADLMAQGDLHQRWYALEVLKPLEDDLRGAAAGPWRYLKDTCAELGLLKMLPDEHGVERPGLVR